MSQVLRITLTRNGHTIAEGAIPVAGDYADASHDIDALMCGISNYNGSSYMGHVRVSLSVQEAPQVTRSDDDEPRPSLEQLIADAKRLLIETGELDKLRPKASAKLNAASQAVKKAAKKPIKKAAKKPAKKTAKKSKR
jgi:hypothetical protein